MTKNTYYFKNIVFVTMKACYARVAAPGSHSSPQNHHEDILAVDQLSVRFYVEYQEAIHIHEALKHDYAQDKENVNNLSQYLAPHPQPLLPRSANITRNPLSSLAMRYLC